MAIKAGVLRREGKAIGRLQWSLCQLRPTRSACYRLGMENVIECSGRIFVALRKAARRPAVGGRMAYHAVTPFYRIALCSTEPGPSSRWAEPPAEEVTCGECLRRLSRLRRMKQA